MSEIKQQADVPQTGISRMLSLPTLVAVIVGISVSQVAVVGVLQGIGLVSKGSLWLIVSAFLIAFLLALTYASTFSELSLMMPSAGGLSTYTEVAIGHFPALLATYSGYVVVNMFGLPVELMLFDNITREVLGLDVPSKVISISLLAVLTVLNIRGTDVFATLQNSTTALKIFLVMATGVVAIWFMPVAEHSLALNSISQSIITPKDAFATSVALFFWCFVAAELVCPMIQIAKSPNRNIPRSMLIGITILATLYASYAFGAMRILDLKTLTGSLFPHLIYAKAVFGRSGEVMALLLAITATVGLVNGILAGVSQMLYGMSKKGQAFSFLGKIHPKYGTPWAAIVFMAIICALPLFILGDKPETITTLVVAASTSWLLAYIVAHVDLIVLRLRYPSVARPYRSPFFPITQIVGVTGMSFVIYNNPIEVHKMTGLVLCIVSVMSASWVHFAMKRRLFTPTSLT